jgi:hypothetical protein
MNRMKFARENRIRSTTWTLALGFVAVSSTIAPAWHLARESGAGCWPPRCADDQLPLATPVISHAGKLYMIGDGAAPHHGYGSRDGKTWRAFQHNAVWGQRYKAADASFAGALWRVGGWVEENGQRIAMNDVWRSEDGAAMGARAAASSLASTLRRSLGSPTRYTLACRRRAA